MIKTQINDLSQIGLRKEDVVACIGYFDGVHLGHQALITKTIERAKEIGAKSMLITFHPDPWSVINRKSNVKHITPLKTKLEVIESFGIDEVVIMKFDSSFSKLSPDDFVNHVLIGLGIVELVIGSDFKFGYKGAGNVSYLKENFGHAIYTHEVNLEETDQDIISSTYLIQTILRGEVDTTEKLLGRPYKISGFVIHGSKTGRKIGFPTANLKIEDEFVIPKEGVYAGYVYVGGSKYQSIVNIGYNPTINTRDELSIETHILDFDQVIYGEVIHQTFNKRLRDELKFDSVDALIDQMENDEIEARNILK